MHVHCVVVDSAHSGIGLQAMASLALPNAGSIAELFGVVELGDLTPMPMDSDGLAPIVDLSIYVRVGAGRGDGTVFFCFVFIF